jgi:hypothetical protein
MRSEVWVSAMVLLSARVGHADPPRSPAAASGRRSATGTVSIVQSRVPYPRTEAVINFCEVTYSKSDPCPPTNVGRCSIRTCDSTADAGVTRVAYTTAGSIQVSVDQEEFRLDPITTGPLARSYEEVSSQWLSTGGPLHGGETVRFEATGDPAGVPAFSGQVIAPVFVTLTTPTSPQIKLGAPFDVAWSPSSPNGILRVELFASRGTMLTTVACEFEGKLGRGTVPAAMIRHLSAGNLVFSVEAISAAVVMAGAFAVNVEVDDSVVSGTAQIR